MNTPAPDWIPDAAKHTIPGWVQRYRLGIHATVVASQGNDHLTCEWLDWSLIGTDDNRSNRPEPNFVICDWRANDAKHDMTPQEVLWSTPGTPRASPPLSSRPGAGVGAEHSIQLGGCSQAVVPTTACLRSEFEGHNRVWRNL